jgi:hypothetical protein
MLPHVLWFLDPREWFKEYLMYTDKHLFYVTLFSNASKTLYPENAVGTFKTELVQSIGLDPNDKWEFGLFEFSYPEISVVAHKIGESENAIICCHLIPAQLLGSFSHCTANSRLKTFILCLWRRG